MSTWVSAFYLDDCTTVAYTTANLIPLKHYEVLEAVMKFTIFGIRVSFLFLLLLVLTGPAWAATVSVTCTGSGTPLQAAVNTAAEGDTINVSGSCSECVKVTNIDQLTIQGTGGATLTSCGGGPGYPTLLLQNSHLFRLQNMTVNGSSGSDAILVNLADGTVEGCTVQGAEGNGINVQNNSSLAVNGSMVQNNGFSGSGSGTFGSGINVNKLSSVTMYGSIVQGNGTSGINVSNFSALALQASTVQNNTGNGVNISNSSLANLFGDNPNTPSVFEIDEIAGNGGTGIFVSGLSNLGGGGAHLIHHNAFRGIQVGNSNAQLGGQSRTQPAEIHDNGFQGVFFVSSTGNLGNYVKVYQNNLNPPVPLPPSPGGILCGVCANGGSSIFLNETEISGNTGHGLFASLNSLTSGRSLTITGNTGDGVHMETASGGNFQPPVTTPTPGTPTNISGNTGNSANCADSFSWIAGDTTGFAKPIKCTVLK